MTICSYVKDIQYQRFRIVNQGPSINIAISCLFDYWVMWGWKEHKFSVLCKWTILPTSPLPVAHRTCETFSLLCFCDCSQIATPITLQEHHWFRAKMEISIISDPLKSVGRIFLGFFPWKICKYLRHLSIHFENCYIVWKDCVVRFCTKEHLNVNMQGIKEN